MRSLDYIVASPDFVIRSEEDFYELITQNTKKLVKLIVFDAESNSTKQVEIVPDFEWGGEGCVGCDIGTGMLHWIPAESASVKPISPQVPQVKSSVVSPIQVQVPLQMPQVPQLNQVPQVPQMPQSSRTPHQIQPQPIQPIQPILPIVVAAPTSRPVFDTLSTASVPAPVIPMQSAPPMGPPRPQQPSPAKPPVISTAEFVFDDIPKPNFTVPSDLL